MPDFTAITSTMQNTGTGVTSMLRQDQYRNLTVSKSLPDYTDLVLENKVFVGSTGTATGIAPVNVLPTTVSALTLFNPSTTLSLIIIRCGVYLLSGTRALGTSLWGAVSHLEEATAPTQDAGVVASGLGHAGTAVGLLDTTITFGTAPPWILMAAVENLADAAESTGLNVENCFGLFIVPPKGNFALQTYTSGAGTTPLYGGTIVWAETVLTRA